jgi:hypothetical protein
MLLEKEISSIILCLFVSFKFVSVNSGIDFSNSSEIELISKVKLLVLVSLILILFISEYDILDISSVKYIFLIICDSGVVVPLI